MDNNDNSKMFDPELLAWSSGGLAVGCVIGACVARALHASTNHILPTAIKSVHEMETVLNRESSVDNMTKFNEHVTTYSQITLLMGSPTASSILDTQEYQQYPASSAYPELSGNR